MNDAGQCRSCRSSSPWRRAGQGTGRQCRCARPPLPPVRCAAARQRAAQGQGSARRCSGLCYMRGDGMDRARAALAVTPAAAAGQCFDGCMLLSCYSSVHFCSLTAACPASQGGRVSPAALRRTAPCSSCPTRSQLAAARDSAMDAQHGGLARVVPRRSPSPLPILCGAPGLPFDVRYFLSVESASHHATWIALVSFLQVAESGCCLGGGAAAVETWGVRVQPDHGALRLHPRLPHCSFSSLPS